jgi:hypothetical protein
LIGGEVDAVALETETIKDRAQVLPTEGRSYGQRRRGVKDDCGRSLIGDAHRVATTRVGQRGSGQFEGDRGDLRRVEFDFAGVGTADVERVLVDVSDDTTLVDDCRPQR